MLDARRPPARTRPRSPGSVEAYAALPPWRARSAGQAHLQPVQVHATPSGCMRAGAQLMTSRAFGHVLTSIRSPGRPAGGMTTYEDLCDATLRTS